MDYKIRRVQHDDANILAAIQTQSWRAVFTDILSADVLERYTNLNKATAMYSELLSKNIGNGYIGEIDGVPHCIAYWDKARNNSISQCAEILLKNHPISILTPANRIQSPFILLILCKNKDCLPGILKHLASDRCLVFIIIRNHSIL